MRVVKENTGLVSDIDHNFYTTQFDQIRYICEKSIPMKCFPFLFIILFLFGCSSSEIVQEEPDLIGAWSLIEQSDKKTPPKVGLLFSTDFQYFDLDSQGQTINRFRPMYWNYANDTLILVNTNTEPHLLDTKGTKTFYVQQLTDSILELNAVDQPYSITYTYQRN